MSVSYQAVGWNRQKKIYDAVLLGGVFLYLGVFLGLGAALYPEATAETLLLRASSTAAFLLLHVILSIGPLCRLDRRLLPLLYNRRHMGVTLFTLALFHGGFAIVQFHAFGDTNPLVSVLISNDRYLSVEQFPFQPLGAAALLILFLMAATSHDFWLANLSAPVWKSLHMLVYVAYALILLHVAFGVLRDETNPIYIALVFVGALWVLGLHVVAGWSERAKDREEAAGEEGFIDVGAASEIPEKRARVVTVRGERVAVFRYDGKVSALSNVCQHQNGPLGEGAIVDGLVVCPWHGYQYQPDCGASPPPFTEKVPTFEVRLLGGRVLVKAEPLPAGTRVEPAEIGQGARMADEFYTGYLPEAPPGIARRVHLAVVTILAAAVALAVVLVSGQRGFSPATYELGVVRDFEGVVREKPYPMLEVERPGRAAGVSRYYLVNPWKAGARVGGREGEPTRVRGSLLYEDDQTMIEILPDELSKVPGASVPASRPVSLGVHRLRGRIVDSKCYLGIMKPGDGKLHRACAARCISGGIPPLFVLSDAWGDVRHLLLVGSDGTANGAEVLDFVDEPLEVDGEVLRSGDLWILRADPASFRRR